jgi:hypothetical protein
MVDQSYVSNTGQFELGQGSLNITTSKREGEERWKTFLFTNKAEARKFAQLWLKLVTDKGKHVRRGSLKQVKLATIERITVQSPGDGSALFTSEIHYRVTSK